MSFLNNACSFTRFKIMDQIPLELWGQLNDKLKQYAFKDIDNTSEEQSFGWVCFDDMLDAQWETAPPEKGAYITFSLRLDTRRIPPAVIKKQLTLALRADLAKVKEQGMTYLNRERKKEIKEQVILHLRTKFLPIPAEFNVIWESTNNTIWFASTQGKMIDLFTNYFIQTFDLHIEQLMPYNLAQTLIDKQQSTMLDSLEQTNFVAQ